MRAGFENIFLQTSIPACKCCGRLTERLCIGQRERAGKIFSVSGDKNPIENNFDRACQFDFIDPTMDRGDNLFENIHFLSRRRFPRSPTVSDALDRKGKHGIGRPGRRVGGGVETAEQGVDKRLAAAGFEGMGKRAQEPPELRAGSENVARAVESFRHAKQGLSGMKVVLLLRNAGLGRHAEEKSARRRDVAYAAVIVAQEQSQPAGLGETQAAALHVYGEKTQAGLIGAALFGDQKTIDP